MMNYLLLKPNGVFEKIGATEPTCSLSLLQKSVNGNVEVISWIPELYDKGIDMWVNDEGKLLNLIPSLAIMDEKGKLIDMIHGNVLFSRFNEDGDTLPLHDEDIDFIKERMTKRTSGYFVNKETEEVTRLSNLPLYIIK